MRHLFLVLTVCIFGPIQPVEAHPGTTGMSEISRGAVPHKTFGGTIAGETSVPLFVVPEGQDFIITGFNGDETGSGGFSERNGLSLHADGLRILDGAFITGSRAATFGENQGRLRVTEGQTLSLTRTEGGSNVGYFLQGRLVEVGSPYRSATGTIADVDITRENVIFTADADRAFVVRSLGLYCQGGAANVLVNGTLVIPRRSNATILTDPPGLFGKGKGALPIPPGGTLAIQSESFTGACDYYMDGEYTHP